MNSSDQAALQPTPADDSFHPPANDDPYWTETCWFEFDQPGSNLSMTLYPVFRPNLGMASLGVYLWDASAYEPWAVKYGRSWWHLPMPQSDLTDLTLEGLRYTAVEALDEYAVTFEDPGVVSIDLRYKGVRPARLSALMYAGPGSGHIDQVCRATGSVTIRGERTEIDCYAMRDRTWAPRTDLGVGFEGAGVYSYGVSSPDSMFLISTFGNIDQTDARDAGHYVRDGVESPFVSGVRRVTSRDERGFPLTFEIEAVDEAGRTLEASGTSQNRLADPATSAVFLWMSMVEWKFDGTTAYGQDQECWHPNNVPRP